MTGFLLLLLSRKWILWLVKLEATDLNNFSRFHVPLSFFFLDLLPFIATRWISALEDCSFSLLLILTRKWKVLSYSIYHYYLKVPTQTLLLCLLLILSMCYGIRKKSAPQLLKIFHFEIGLDLCKSWKDRTDFPDTLYSDSCNVNITHNSTIKKLTSVQYSL